MASKNSSGESYGKGRTRNFASVVYPESAPENWLDILNEMHIPAFISPLHDSDINPDGEIKKAHYHIMIMFDAVKTREQAKVVFDSIGAVGSETIQSQRGYARYLCHLDNPEKTQYDIADVKALYGADYNATISLVTDKYKAIGEMIDFCEENAVISFSDLLVYARRNRFDWFRVLSDSGSVVMREYLKSKSWTIDREEKNNAFR